MSDPVQHYVVRAGAFAGICAALLVTPFLFSSVESALFALVGWTPMALIGVAGGGWAVARYGSAGHGFPLAVLTCILLRLSLGLGGLAWAASQRQVTPYLAGSLVTFVVMQAFESTWFLRRSRQPAVG
jgi:hypothetical protein